MQSLKHFVMYGWMFALVGLTACNTLDASVSTGDGGDGNPATQARSGELLQQMDRDSQSGGE
jgi:hypothetical protein